MSSSDGNDEESSDQLTISLRAYVPPKSRPIGFKPTDIGPSDWTLIFDCETTTDERQTLRFGVYQVRKGSELWEAGLFVYPDILGKADIREIQKYSEAHNFRCMTAAEFVENVFFGIGYELRATIVGFNLPFDISRLAISHGNSRGRTMKGGFSFKLSPHKFRPNIQIKHLSPRTSLIRFTTRPGRIAGRGMRRRRQKLPPRPGYFVDVKTLGAALTSQSLSLASLAELLRTDSQKLGTDEHGQKLTPAYLKYAVQDVQVTWECYCKLLDKFATHNFSGVRPDRIFSEASIGKAYFAEMGIRPWRECQPDFPPDLIGIILSTYFGGRSEVHHRRIVSQVSYCDFLSMYPTCCTLMQLWKFVIANGLKWRDATRETKTFLTKVTLSDLQAPGLWTLFPVLVQIRPDKDIVPVRANYGHSDQATIGLNYLSGDRAYWFTLADCIASKLLTGKCPKVLKAVGFTPDGVQSDLRPIQIAGNPEYRIEPSTDDFYRRLIDLRSSIKAQIKDAAEMNKSRLKSEQLALKITANAASYGLFVELNVEELSKPEIRQCYGYTGEPFDISTGKVEEPGRYFHPLLASLITGAARLMLAITERLIIDHGLDWALCDTDSMAIAKPDGMAQKTFQTKVDAIRRWFEPLNPYREKSSLLKLEDANFGENGQLEPLYCLAVSAKRYALFNLSSGGQVILRKASAHGLGHLLPPYRDDNPPTTIAKPLFSLRQIGVERWQHDLWHQIIRAALDDHPDQVDLNYHLALKTPAASRYAATTPKLLAWFRKHNSGRPYADQVRPSDFMLSFQISPTALSEYRELLESQKPSGFMAPELPRPIAPFDADSTKAARRCFDRDTGKLIPRRVLQTYQDALCSYHLRPEHKFSDGSYADRGITRRRHVAPNAVRNIGKESNRWTEQFYLGADETAEVEYGATSEEEAVSFERMRQEIAVVGQREFSRHSGISRRTISKFVRRLSLRRITMQKIIAVRPTKC